MIPARPRSIARLLVAGAVILLGPSTSRAAILRVPDDHATLAAAIAAAVPGADEIWVSSAGSPYVLDTTLVLRDGLVYRGGWDPNFISQNATTRVHLAADSTGSVIDASQTTSSVTFTHFTIGPPAKPSTGITQQGAGMFISGSSLLVANCRFENNVSVVSGGAIQIGSGSSAHIQDCVFDENETGLAPGSGRGGAIAVGTGGGGVFLEHCRFTNNAADSAGAFTSAAGGAVFAAAPIRVERCWFENNFSGSDGGALYARNADVRGWGNLFYFNSAGRNGGAVYYQNGNGELQGCLVEDCTAGTVSRGNGGAVYFEGGTNRFTDGYVRRCEALGAGGDGLTQGAGGAFYLWRPNASTAIRNTEITGNRAQMGGGICIQGLTSAFFSDADILGNTIVGNHAAIASAPRTTAGGIHVFDNFLGEFVNNIIAQQEDGCGIACESPAGGTQPSPNIRYNCVWNDASNADANYGGRCVDRTGISGNISANPGLCCFLGGGCQPVGTGQPDVQLSTGSPCLGTGEGGADMGAYPGGTGCMSPVSLESSSWGAIKARYR